jgi:hypothetical protein
MVADNWWNKLDFVWMLFSLGIIRPRFPFWFSISFSKNVRFIFPGDLFMNKGCCKNANTDFITLPWGWRKRKRWVYIEICKLYDKVGIIISFSENITWKTKGINWIFKLNEKQIFAFEHVRNQSTLSKTLIETQIGQRRVNWRKIIAFIYFEQFEMQYWEGNESDMVAFIEKRHS